MKGPGPADEQRGGPSGIGGGAGVAPVLHLLSAGAAQGLVKAIEADFAAATGATLAARFGAVGAMREALDGGAPCDVIVLTAALIDTLVRAGQVHAASRRTLGAVRTGIAVRAGQAWPDVTTPAALRAALLAADAVHVPDTERSTAGIHVADMLRRLGIHDEVAPRLRTAPNGATAMRELAASTAGSPIGCTQVTEIRYTPGVELVRLLPSEFELSTAYVAAVATLAADGGLAARFIERLTGETSAALRRAGGFEP